MTGKRVMVAPLDWGLGHATRCIPIIHELLALECEVLLAGSGQSLQLLKQEFPHVNSIELPGYAPVYPASGSMMFKLALQTGKFMRVVVKEQNLVTKIIADEKIDIIVSDNRYGCYSNKIPCVFITHQPKLRAAPGWGWLGFLANAMINRFINKYTFCWIPDYPGSVLTGALSNTSSQKFKFIGPLSRFKNGESSNEKKYDVLALISGPEPQRSIFESLLTNHLVESGLKALLVRGVVDNNEKKLSDRVEMVDHLNSESLETAILESELIISRSGYSTIMDLVKLGKKAVFVPTPGQTEQEYLAKRFTELGIAYSINQNSFSLRDALAESKKYTGFNNYTDQSSLKKELTEILKQPKPMTNDQLD